MTESTPIPTPGNDSRLDGCLALWDSFLANLAAGTRAGVVFHGDTDGLVGAVYIAALLRKLRGAAVRFHCVHTNDYDFEPLRTWLTDASLDTCVVLDISLANHSETIDVLGRACKSAFIFDHHQQDADLVFPESVLVANPTPSSASLGRRPVPTFLFAQAIASREHLPMPPWLLLVAFFCEGVDSFYLNDVARLFGSVFATPAPANPRAAFRASAVASFCNLIRAGFATSDGENTLLAIFSDVASGRPLSLHDVHEALAKRFGEVSRDIARAISTYVDKWNNTLSRDINGRLAIIPVDSRYDIAGPVASILRGSFPDKVIVAYRMHRSLCTVELRTRNDTRLNLAAMAKDIATRVPVINAGGHPSAAGALMSKQSLAPFLDALRAAIGS